MIKIENLDHLYQWFNSMNNMEIDWNKIIIKWDGWEYKVIHSSIIKTEPINLLTWEVIWYNPNININKSIRVEFKTRYIKTQDKIILKGINAIETY